MSSTSVVIPSRYAGPPSSANGGYACGVTARGLGDAEAVAVVLLAPPPMDRPLTLRAEGGEASLSDGDSAIALARPGVKPEDGPLVSREQAAAAARAFDLDDYARRHAFPMCYTCGPERTEGSGLRIFPAPIGTPGVVTWPWVPHASTGDEDGTVEEAVLWAALDCPSGMSWSVIEPDLSAIVLSKMTATIYRRPSVGEQLVATGWAKESQGRKRMAGASLRTTAGDVVAAAHATWVVLSEEQQLSFQAAVPRK